MSFDFVAKRAPDIFQVIADSYADATEKAIYEKDNITYDSRLLISCSDNFVFIEPLEFYAQVFEKPWMKERLLKGDYVELKYALRFSESKVP